MARRVIPIAGKYPDSEEAILLYLYENPEVNHSTDSLASALRDGSCTATEIADGLMMAVGGCAVSDIELSEAKRSKPQDVQKGIEALIVRGLVIGRRQGAPGKITHTEIQLTLKGEREAIDAKNRVQAVVIRQIGRPEDLAQ